MGLFDYFSKEAATERKRERCRKKLTNMYYQKADRLASAEGAYELAREGDIESIRVLLARFEHLCPSHTIDREEKEYVVELLVSLEDPAVEQIVDYCRKTAKGIYWPIQVLEELWPHEKVSDFLAEILEATDTDYWRDPEKKVGLVQLAGEHESERVGLALLPFVEDHSEEVRFTAVDNILNRNIEGTHGKLLPRLAGEEESLRIVNRIANGFADKGWSVGDRADEVKPRLPAALEITPKNHLRRRPG